jgi:hypothetical protein
MNPNTPANGAAPVQAGSIPQPIGPPAGPATFTPAGMPRYQNSAEVAAASNSYQPGVQQPLAPPPQPQYAAPPQPAPVVYPTAQPPQTQQPIAAAYPAQAPPQAQVSAAPSGQPVPGAVAPHSNPNSTQNTLQIAEIRDGIVIMNDGSYRSVVMVKSINFDLMSGQEQEAVEYSYQGFLNSLYFPIQIFMRSSKVDLQPYIEKLDKIRTEHDNMLLALLMEDYIGYIDALSQQTNIMDKRFYVVIPFFPTADVQKALSQSKNFFGGLGGIFRPKEQHVTINEGDLEKAKAELRNRVQAVLSGLQQCSIQGLPLDTQELIELYYDTYNPDTATRQELKNFNNLTADIIVKGAGSAPQAHLQRELQ